MWDGAKEGEKLSRRTDNVVDRKGRQESGDEDGSHQAGACFQIATDGRGEMW